MREHSAAAPYVRSDGLPLTPELLDEFLDSLRRKGRTPETLLTYRRNLNLLYDSLSGEKECEEDSRDKIFLAACFYAS